MAKTVRVVMDSQVKTTKDTGRERKFNMLDLAIIF